MYVSKLRTKNLQYKKCRGDLASLRSEHGVLNRTEVILSKLQDQTNRRLVAAENKKGVSGTNWLEQVGTGFNQLGISKRCLLLLL